jgi:serine phosphatase RsbU (regulator of sigma subunit)/anti-sigma regulatory factor (Ser/Thr protein kinase)
VAEREGEDPRSGTPVSRGDRAELVATTIALLWVSVVALIDAVYSGKFGLIGFLAIGPFIAAAFAGVRRTALVGLYATLFSLILSTPPRQYDELNHLFRVLTLLASSGVAIWISSLRLKRSQQLWSARTETRIERRRRVAAETAQSMQALARALTTSADPAQVADAVFGALRDELQVDAAIFAATNDRGVLGVHRRFGYASDEPARALLAALEPDGDLGAVLQHRVAFFAESLNDQRRDCPNVAASPGADRFSSMAVVPLVVSDHAVGAVVVQWERNRLISPADKSFLFTITGAAAQAVERARLTLTEFTNLERSQRLHHLSSALAAATTPDDVAREAIAGARRALGAQSAACRIPVRGEPTLLCLANGGEPALLSAGRVPVEHTPSGSTFTSGRTMITTLGISTDVDADMTPEIVPQVMVEIGEPVTIVTEALTGTAGTLGVLTLAFVARPEPSEPELRFLSTLAGLTAQALERAQLFEQERMALRDAESGRERLSLLSDVTKLLSSSLDPTTVMQRTMNLVVGRLADACVVQVPNERGLRRLDVRGVEALTSLAVRELIGADEIPFDSAAPAAVAYRTGRAHLRPLTSVPPGTGEVTALAVPFTASGEVIGVMSFFAGPGRRFEPDDISLAAEVANRTGVALSNATRYQREHVVAEVLQRAVLPDFLPSVGGVQFDAEYRPGAAGTYVGGDWYDVFQLDDERVIFSVGDVMGKGAPAAALMGQVRSAIRAYAVSGQSPSEVLSSLDHLFDALVEDRVVTVVVGTLNPKLGSIQLANAGHPSPLIVRADGTAAFSSTQSSLLIAAGLGGAARPSDDLTLRPGDSLVMYSDGLVERRGELITMGMQRLADTATEVARAGWPDHPAAELATRLGEDERGDDVVVLALRYLGLPAEDREPSRLGRDRSGMSTLRLDPVVESTPAARHWVTELLQDVPSEVTECAALLTSELVTNAVLHAGTPFTVTLHVMADRIRVDVADANPVVPSIKDYAADAATGRGLTLFNTLASDWGVQPVTGGKIVWFELPVDYSITPTAVSDGTFRFDLIGIAKPQRSQAVDQPPPVTVDLVGIPVALLQKASEEYEALFRELRLMKEHAESKLPPSSLLPERLSVLLSEIGTRFNGFGPGMDESWQDVVDRKVETYDWHLDLPSSAVEACQFYDAMLDEADEFGLVAQLLTLPASAASVAVRRWFLSQLIAQLHGQASTSWADSAEYRELMQRASPT